MLLYQNDPIDLPVVEPPVIEPLVVEPQVVEPPVDVSSGSNWGLHWFESIVTFFRNLYQSAVDTISGFFGALFEFVSTYLQWCMSVVSSWFSTLLGWCQDLIFWVCDGIVYFLSNGWALFFGEDGVVWLPLNWMQDLLDWFFGVLLDFSTDHFFENDSWQAAMDVAGAFDVYFPFTELFWMGLLFLTFMTFFLLIKAVLKLIPTIG